MTSHRNRTFADVVVLGSGLAGSTAALCLRKQGLDVVIIDRGTHPRFALGESTTTPSSLWLRLLAEKFDAPELLDIASAESITRAVGPTSGIKNNFGFLYHRSGSVKPESAWQAIIPQAFLAESELDQQAAYNEMHYFRQDVDAYLWSMALAAGAIGRSATEVTDIDFDSRGVTVATADGEVFRGQFLIDACGYRSPVARKLGLRDALPRMRTNSRALFTHMIGVEHFENTRLVPDSMAPWSQGTLHHFFDGGWLWVIPFDNHRDSTNRLCSVGLNLDNRRFPKPEGMSAEDEWRAFLADHPAIRRQFERATAVRPWVHTGRLQYSSSNCVGDRYWLTAHAAGAVDALYSMGNINTFQTVATGLSLILRSFSDGRFHHSRFRPLQQLTDNLLRLQDRIVYGSYVGFRDPRLLQTWIALWSTTDTARIRTILIPLVKYFRRGDPHELDFCIDDAATLVTGIGMNTGITDTETVLGELDDACDLMLDLEEGRATVDETVERLNGLVQGRPHFHIDLAVMEEAFAKLPWAYEPLARNSLRCYGNCFLTPDEMNTLGLNGTRHAAPAALQTARARSGTSAARPAPTPRNRLVEVHADPKPRGTVQLEQEGHCVLRGVFSDQEIGDLRAEILEVYAKYPPDLRGGIPSKDEAELYRYQLFNRSALCQKAIANERILAVVEPLLGDDCHAINCTAWRNPPGGLENPKSLYWHIDGGPHVPRPKDVDWPDGIPYPIFVIATHIYLEECSSDDGPTAVIPTSHRSGQAPPTDLRFDDDLVYRGRGRVEHIARAGDVGLFVSDVWHRRAQPTTRSRGRFFLQTNYGRRDIAQRILTTEEASQTTEESRARATTERERNLIGLHKYGFYDG